MSLRRPARSHVLILLGAMFVGSAILRGSLSATAVMASVPSSAPSATESVCPEVEGPAALVSALQEREARVAEREAELDTLERQLSDARVALAEQISDLEMAEAALRESLAIADRGAEVELAQLTSVYESMKPDDAARLFAEMAPEFGAGFLGRMSPAAAAGILAGLDPADAYAMSVLLAGQNANAPQN